MAQDNEAKRATTVLTIAQLKFKQALKKEDLEARLPPVSVEISSIFFNSLDAVLDQNTSANVQKCTEWIIRHILSSKHRIVALGDYLVAVAKSIIVDQQSTIPSGMTLSNKPARNRLDILLVVNDVLHIDSSHHRSNTRRGTFSTEIVPFVLKLVDLAASVVIKENPVHERKLKAIVNYWMINDLISHEDYESIRNSAEESLIVARGGQIVRKRNFLLPEYHGDKFAPWHELPASYMLDQMISHPKLAINPSLIKVIKMEQKPVSPHVRKLLDNYFDNIDLKYYPTSDNPQGEAKDYKLSLDAMGQLTKRNKETHETSMVCNGYGWSAKFCQDMQRHGVSENIRIMREDAERMEHFDDKLDGSRNRRLDRRYSRSPRRHDHSPSSSEKRRGRDKYGRSRSDSRGRRESRSSHSSHRSRSRTHRRSRSRRQRPRTDLRKDLEEQDQRYEHIVAHPRRALSQSRDRRASPRGLEWSGSHSGDQVCSLNSQSSLPAQSVPPRLPLGQLPLPFPLGQIPAPPFPDHGAFSAGFVPPPPPPSFGGPFPPPPPDIMAAMQYHVYNASHQLGIQANNPGSNNNGSSTHGSGFGSGTRGNNANIHSSGKYGNSQRGYHGRGY